MFGDVWVGIHFCFPMVLFISYSVNNPGVSSPLLQLRSANLKIQLFELAKMRKQNELPFCPCKQTA